MFFSLSAFVFLFLESACIAHHLVAGVTCPLADKIRILVALGFAAPFLYTAIAVPASYNDLIPNDLRM